MKIPVSLISGIILLLFACDRTPADPVTGRPNILLVITDDQGYGDIGVHGNPFIRTPVLDSLARLSTRVDPFYVCPVCAPTRSSLMTGRYHLRTGVYDTYNGGAMMAANEVTIAEHLAENGYRTAMIGKWHLGDSYPMRPGDQGFQYYLAHKAGGIGQPGDDFGNYSRPDSSYFDPWLWENGERVRRTGYCSDVFTDQAIEFITGHVADGSPDPFFLYLSYNAPHTPLQLPGEYEAEYRDMDYGVEDFPDAGANVLQMSEKDRQDARRVYGMVSNIDDNLGRIWNTLADLGLEENTLLVFLTDNGPQQRRYTAGLSGRKSSVLEGGIRVPCFFYWKGKLEAGRIIRYPSAHIDMLPTLLEMAGCGVPGGLDGISLLPLLKGEQETLGERPLFFAWARGYPQRYTNMAVRKGPFKLAGFTEYGDPEDSLRLFRLDEDPGENHDIARVHPDVKNELKAELDKWYEDVIRSRNLLDPPRIILGSDEENPVILNRNDWKGPTAKQWGSPAAYGFWDVEVTEPGTYDVQLVFRDPVVTGSTAHIQCGVRHYWMGSRDGTRNSIAFPSVQLDEGKHSFSGWIEVRNGILTPICIEIFKN